MEAPLEMIRRYDLQKEKQEEERRRRKALEGNPNDLTFDIGGMPTYSDNKLINDALMGLDADTGKIPVINQAPQRETIPVVQPAGQAGDEDISVGEDISLSEDMQRYINQNPYKGLPAETEEVKVDEYYSEIDLPDDPPKKVIRPSNPASLLKASRETGEPWQEMLVQAYISKNPWLDQHRVRKAVYSTADKHHQKWLDGGGASRGSYRSSLASDLGRRGRSSGRSSSGRKSKSNYKNKADKSLAWGFVNNNAVFKRYIDILNEAKRQSQKVYDEDMARFRDKTEGLDAEIKGAKPGQRTALDDAMEDSFKKRHITADNAVNILMRESGIGQRKELRYNRAAAQKEALDILTNDLKKAFINGDKDTVDFVNRFKTGKKVGNNAFARAAMEMWLDLGMDDVTLTQGNRFRKKRKKK